MIIEKLNKAFESRIRLGIMSALMVEDDIDFNTMKELLNATDGNIASHISALEKLNYISIDKSFIGRKTRTAYSATKQGKKAFRDHLDALESLINRS